jgi:hypothetical protein
MSDSAVLSQMRALQRKVGQTEVKEIPGGITGFSTFYDTGTWTPAYQGTTIAGTFTYVANGQTGRYTRIGNQVFIHCYVQISAISVAPTGNMQITGLPFTAANISTVDFSLAIGFMDRINTSANVIQLTALVRLATTVIWLGESFDNLAWARFPAANFNNGNEGLELSGFYQV